MLIDDYAFILVDTYAATATGHNEADISVAAMEVTARWDEIDASAEVLSPVAGLAGDNALHILGARSVVFCGRAAIAPRGCVADVRATPMRRGQIDGEFQRCAARWRPVECHSATIADRWRPQNN